MNAHFLCKLRNDFCNPTYVGREIFVHNVKRSEIHPKFWLHWPWKFKGFPHSSVGKESTCNAGDPNSILGLRRSAGKGIGYPLQCSWIFLVAQLVKNLPAMRETWVRKIPWKRERPPTPVFWTGEYHGHGMSRKELDTTDQVSLHFKAEYQIKSPFFKKDILIWMDHF